MQQASSSPCFIRREETDVIIMLLMPLYARLSEKSDALGTFDISYSRHTS